MISDRIVACVLGVALLLSADVADAARFSRKAVLPDAGDHPTRREHEAYCERAKATCLANHSRFSTRNHERVHCKIDFDQCMNR